MTNNCNFEFNLFKLALSLTIQIYWPQILLPRGLHLNCESACIYEVKSIAYVCVCVFVCIELFFLLTIALHKSSKINLATELLFFILLVFLLFWVFSYKKLLLNWHARTHRHSTVGEGKPQNFLLNVFFVWLIKTWKILMPFNLCVSRNSIFIKYHNRLLCILTHTYICILCY